MATVENTLSILKKKRQLKKEIVIKEKKVKGKKHVNHRGKEIEERTTGPDCRCTHLKCFEKVSPEARKPILDQFNSFSSKNEQDSHLAGLIGISSPVRRRPRKRKTQTEECDEYSLSKDATSTGDNSAVFSYKLRMEVEEIQVCFKAFCSFHGITRGRIRNIQQSLVRTGQAPKDKRGSHSNRPKKLPLPIEFLVCEHIESFQARMSHYSYRINPNRRYLPETLSVAKMHKLFLLNYWIKIPYLTYYNIFHEKYNLHFGMPRSDTCGECDGYLHKIQSVSDPDQKRKLEVEREVHHRKAEKFRKVKRAYKVKAECGEITMLSFDFMQNLPLPHIKTSDVFYARQLWYFVFGIHDVGENKVTMMVYDELTGKKGQNDVTSLLFKYICIENNGFKENLVLISDGCPGQNKNYVMIKFLYILVHCLHLFKTIRYVFPIRGHTYLPNDQDFSLIGKKKVTHTAEIKEDWDNIIKEAREKPSPFHLVNVKQGDLLNVAEALSPYFLKVPKPPMRLKGVRMINITLEEPAVLVRHSFSGSWVKINIRNKVKIPEELTFKPLYENALPLNPAKLKDVQRLSRFLQKPENKTFYDNLSQITEQHNMPVNPEMSDDDNSSGTE